MRHVHWKRLFVGVVLVLSSFTGLGCVDKPTEHRVRAMAFFKQDKHAEALRECEEGLKLAPKNVALYIIKGKTLFELERLPEASKAYSKALEYGKALPPTSVAEAHLGIAVIAMRKKDYPTAAKHFRALAKANPRDGHAQLNVARVCLQLNDIDCAVKHAEQAGRLRGRSEEVLFTLGRIYTIAKKFDEADKTFARICEVVKAAASCPYGRALVAAQRGENEKAFEHLKVAVERKLPNPDRLSSDPLLKPLRTQPAFEKLVAQAKK